MVPSIVLMLVVIITTTAVAQHPPVTVKLCPRSQWDPDQSYRAARMVVTRAVRICDVQGMSSDGECGRWQDAWTTISARFEPHLDPGADIESEYHLEGPHTFEMFRTYDNLTYDEIPSDTEAARMMIETLDKDLLRQVEHVARRVAEKMVLRWDYGHLWYVPAAYWNAGERALHTGTPVQTLWQASCSKDDPRPMYYP